MIISFIVFFWLVFLTLIWLRLRQHYFSLLTRTRKQTIDEIIDFLTESVEILKSRQTDIEERVLKLSEETKKNFQKIAIKRFNPFEGVESGQSFVIALLNKENDGLILNFIYTKDNFRVFPKKIKAGKGDGVELSQEEKEVVNQLIN